MRNQAEYARQTAIAQAQYQAEIDQAQQTAAQAGPLAAAQAQQEVLVEQALVAQKNAELRQAELIAEVVRPAEAEAERITTLARAQADATKLSAEAAAAAGPHRARPARHPAAARDAPRGRRRACRAPTSPCSTAPRGSTAWSPRWPPRAWRCWRRSATASSRPSRSTG